VASKGPFKGAAFDAKVKRIKDKYSHLVEAAERIVRHDLAVVAERTVNNLKRTTPRSVAPGRQLAAAQEPHTVQVLQGSGKHLADQWRFAQTWGGTYAGQVGGLSTEVLIYNEDPRANAPMGSTLPLGVSGPLGPPPASGKSTLLQILEYGSRPHRIVPKKAGGILVFTSRTGRTVRTKRVMHPGTRPYGMIGAQRTFLAVVLKTMANKIRTEARTRIK